MKPAIIFNPTAGSATDQAKIASQMERLEPSAVHVTNRAGQAEEVARMLVRGGCQYLVAGGGDGTLNEVVNGIGESASAVQVGLIPLGTGNDFARTLELPEGLEQNIEILLAQKTTALDLVRVTSESTRFFINVSAGGFSGLVDEMLTPEIKQTWGPLAYLRTAATALPQLHGYETTVTFDDDDTISMELYNVVIGNGRFVAAGLPIAPNADPRDGLLDVILIPKRSIPEMAMVIAEMLLGKHLSNEAILFRRARKVSVSAVPGMWFNVDGELIGNSPVVFQIVPRALKFVTGRQ